jgi:hypothetical protein
MTGKNKAAFLITGVWLSCLVLSSSTTLGATTLEATIFGWVTYPVMGFMLVREILSLLAAGSRYSCE